MQINIEKRHFYLLTAIFVFLVGVGFVVSYGGNQPTIMGHSGGEVMVNIGGVDKTLQQAINDGDFAVNGSWCGWYANTAGQTADSTFTGNEIPCVINGVSYSPNPASAVGCPPGFERVKVATYYISHDGRRNPVYTCIRV